MVYRIAAFVFTVIVFLVPGLLSVADSIQASPEFATVDIDRISVIAAPDELTPFMEMRNVDERLAIVAAETLERDQGYQTDYVKLNKRPWVPAVKDIDETDLVWADDLEDDGHRFVLITSLQGYEFTQSTATLKLHAKLLDTLERHVLWNGEMTYEGDPAILIDGLVELAGTHLALSLPHNAVRSMPMPRAPSGLSTGAAPIDVLSPISEGPEPMDSEQITPPQEKHATKRVSPVWVEVEDLPLPVSAITPMPPPLGRIEVIHDDFVSPVLETASLEALHITREAAAPLYELIPAQSAWVASVPVIIQLAGINPVSSPRMEAATLEALQLTVEPVGPVYGPMPAPTAQETLAAYMPIGIEPVDIQTPPVQTSEQVALEALNPTEAPQGRGLELGASVSMERAESLVERTIKERLEEILVEIRAKSQRARDDRRQRASANLPDAGELDFLPLAELDKIRP